MIVDVEKTKQKNELKSAERKPLRYSDLFVTSHCILLWNTNTSLFSWNFQNHRSNLCFSIWQIEIASQTCDCSLKSAPPSWVNLGAIIIYRASCWSDVSQVGRLPSLWWNVFHSNCLSWTNQFCSLRVLAERESSTLVYEEENLKESAWVNAEDY